MRSNPPPRTLDPAATRKLILEAALKLFSERGFAATSISEIAASAGVTKSLVIYHFESKEDLWSACVDLKVRPALAMMSAFLESGEPIDRALPGLIRAKYEIMRGDPELRRLMAWNSLENIRPPKEMAAKARMVRARLEGQADTLPIPPGVDCATFIMILLSACDGWFRFRSLYETAFGVDASTKEAEDAFLEGLLKTAFRAEPREAVHEA